MRVSLAPLRLAGSDRAGGSRAARRRCLAARGARMVLGGGVAARRLGAADRARRRHAVRPARRLPCRRRRPAVRLRHRPSPAADLAQAPGRTIAPRRSADRPAGFLREGRNAKGEVGAATLNVPTGVCAVRRRARGRRRLEPPRADLARLSRRSNRPADVVLGQAISLRPRQSRRRRPRADTLNWCYGVAIVDGRLIVADTGNRRVLVWNEVPRPQRRAGRSVLGQRDFDYARRERRRGAGASGMRWPHGDRRGERPASGLRRRQQPDHGLASWPRANGAPCDFVLGQADVAGSTTIAPPTIRPPAR